MAGPSLIHEYLNWATVVFPTRFAEKLLHTSLTVEESTRAEMPAVHLHAQFTFAKRIDRQLLAR